MLVNPKKYLIDARKNGYAIGAFNTSDLEMTQAILEAGNILKSPIIIQTSEKAIAYAGLDNLASIVKNESKKYNIPIVLHLDHGKNLEIIKKCLKVGYTSVMFDGSNLSFNENVSKTKQIVKIAKVYNAQVEAEIGALSGIEENISAIQNLTDPKEARDFVEKTGIDSLAIAFGNAHGIPDPDEKLDFERLKEISDLVKIPLVFHGASSTPKKDMQKAISLGVAKVNIDTDIRLAFSESIKKFQSKKPNSYDPREILFNAKESVKKVVMGKIRIFGSRGKI